MIPLVAPCITRKDRDYLVDRAYNYGLLQDEAEVRRFEEAFAARVGCEWAAAVNSGTSALIVACEAVDRTHLRLPSWSCMAIRNAAIAWGADIDYVDSTWDVKDARASCSGAEVLVHMFGTPTGMAIPAAIEDWTLSLGGVNWAARLGVCSTFATKMISTGRGGLVFGDDPELHERVKELAHYETHTGFGYSVGMTSMQAALGNSQLAQLDGFIARRRELAHRYTEAFRPAGIECPDSDCGSVFFRYLIAVDSPEQALGLLMERGIEAGRGVYPPLHQLAGLPDEQFPGTMAAVNSLLSVPVHPSITDEQASHIIEAVKAVCAP